jgi:hypothetical protein
MLTNGDDPECSISRRLVERFHIIDKHIHNQMINFGKEMKARYMSIHGCKPPQREQYVGGTLHKVNNYHIRDWEAFGDQLLEQWLQACPRPPAKTKSPKKAKSKKVKPKKKAPTPILPSAGTNIKQPAPAPPIIFPSATSYTLEDGTYITHDLSSPKRGPIKILPYDIEGSSDVINSLSSLKVGPNENGGEPPNPIKILRHVVDEDVDEEGVEDVNDEDVVEEGVDEGDMGEEERE